MKNYLLRLLGLGLALGACRGQPSQEAPWHGIQNMFNQKRWEAQEETQLVELFPDRRTNRPVPAGTVPQGALKDDDFFYRGKKADGTYATTFPMDVTIDVMKHGERRYATYCTPCHGPVGQGNGIVAQRGNLAAANLLKDQYVQMSHGEMFNVITNGKNTMPAYNIQINEEDRWAIVAYVRALQKSQTAKLSDIPEAKRGELK